MESTIMRLEKINILLAPDSFKESLTATEVCQAMKLGIHNVNPNINVVSVPLADGGEGTLEALVNANNGVIHYVDVLDPLGNTVSAPYGILENKAIAVVEMAKASGLMLVPPNKRNPLKTTTYGTGQLIKACLNHNITKIIIGIGGSATNDGGVGAMQALGISFKDQNAQELSFGGENLELLKAIDYSGLDPRLKNVAVEIAGDVANTLCGDFGASKVFAPQKGATEKEVDILEKNLKFFGEFLEKTLEIDVFNVKGLGAAGGLGCSLYAFLNAKMKSGIDIVMENAELEEKIKKADMVWTGEGAVDKQTSFGKAPLGVAQLAKKYNKFVVVLTGKIGSDIDILYESGIDAIFGIIDKNSKVEELFAKAQVNIRRTSENILRLLKFKNN